MVIYESIDETSKKVVLSYINALNEQDFKKTRDFFSDKFSYNSPVVSLDNPDEYVNFMSKQKGIKYNIKKIFIDGTDVCLLYDITIGDKTNFSCGWYQIKNNKISSLRVLLPYTSFQ